MVYPHLNSPEFADHNLLFGVLALQVNFIDKSQFVDACAAWTARKDKALADLLKERGWISEAEKDLITQFLARDKDLPIFDHSAKGQKSGRPLTVETWIARMTAVGAFVGCVANLVFTSRRMLCNAS